jgi:outer membrane protein assembly factor BamE (lipoprotein component of BamABCDE complex)
MKIAMIVIVGIFIFSACSQKKSEISEKEYQRSNAASEKALNKLDRE